MLFLQWVMERGGSGRREKDRKDNYCHLTSVSSIYMYMYDLSMFSINVFKVNTVIKTAS